MSGALNERQEAILGEVVRAYLETGAPVPSKRLARQGRLGLSPASIRNVMADLERLGMLASPHTSAGRVPTDSGLRYFVDTLMTVDPRLQARLEQEVARHLAVAGEAGASEEEVLRRATDELAELSRYAGMVWVRERGFSRIERLELVPVSSEKVLAVVVTDLGDVQNRLLERPNGLDDAQLARVGRRLNALLQGCALHEVRDRLRDEMEADRRHILRLIEGLKDWTRNPTDRQADLFVRGQPHLLETPELAVIDTVRSMLAAFEEKEQLLHLVEQVENDERGVKVFIGSEHALVNLEQVSVVLSRYEGGQRIVGTLGVIGPRSMPYDRVLPIVDCTARWVSRMLGGIN